MTREKIDFGIDLGTTNSAVASMTNGTLKVIKSDAQMDTTPSLVQVSPRGLRTGKKVDVRKRHFSEFKRTMGSDKSYQTSASEKAFSSEELSAEILKTLRSYVLDEEVMAAVITVPNQFTQNQIDATQRAAEIAGIQYCELLQEPIAASMAYGIESGSMSGHWIVFDFGGGTFDAALMRVDDGIMKVVDTSGDNFLGGKDIDRAVIDEVLIPLLEEQHNIEELKSDRDFRLALVRAAQSLKIALSNKPSAFHDEFVEFEDDDGEEIVWEFEVSLSDFEKAVKPIYQKAIEITSELLARNSVNGESLDRIILVGGPTFSQTLRTMLRETFENKVDTSIDPMTSVAVGAALYASTRSIPSALKARDDSKLQLIVKYAETTIEEEENVGIRIDPDAEGNGQHGSLWLEVQRRDKAFSSERIQFDGVEIVNLRFNEGKINVFDINLYDDQGNRVDCQPSSFTITHGLKAAKQTLPHSISIEYVRSDSGKQRLGVISGLERNTPLPAKGTGKFKTQKLIRPAKREDKLVIPIYEGNEGEIAALNDKCAILQCSGDDFPAVVPEGSDVEVTIKIDTSRKMTIEAYFPAVDETIEKEVSKSIATQKQEIDGQSLKNEINKAAQGLNLSDAEIDPSIEQELQELAAKIDRADEDYDEKLVVKERLNKVLQKIEDQEELAEWPATEKKLLDILASAHELNDKLGSHESGSTLAKLEEVARAAIQDQDIKVSNALIEQISTFNFMLLRENTGFWISMIKDLDDDFHSQEWSDRSAARELINEAKHVIAHNPNRENLERIVSSLFALLPNKEQPILGGGNSELLMR